MDVLYFIDLPGRAVTAFPNSLPPEEKNLVTQAADIYRRLMAVNHTGCEYCKPPAPALHASNLISGTKSGK